MKYSAYILVILFSSCSKTLDLDLPKYEPKLSVEFYLEEGKPLRCLLQESLNYTDERLIELVEGATVILKYGNIVDTLRNDSYVDAVFQKAYNYYNPKLFVMRDNIEYQLYIKDRQGREMTSSTISIPRIKIDSAVYDFNQDGDARVGLIFTDPGQSKNYYRIVAYPADTTVSEEETWSFNLTDNSFNGQRFSFFTGYAFEKNTSVVARLYNLDSYHYIFEQSVSTARQSNFNPFGQPSPIISNVVGGHGIFTILRYDEIIVDID
jgi:hypothetical protein